MLLLFLGQTSEIVPAHNSHSANEAQRRSVAHNSMQVSPSLADFMSRLEQGPQGLDDAAAIIDKCARQSSSVLDLQQMHLTDDEFEVISAKFSTVAAHVTTLNLFMNEISVLPEAIATLSNLEVLTAGCNPLERIQPELLKGLSKLREIDVGFSECLEELPDTFDSCHALRTVLAGNGRLQKVPPSLFRCEELEELHLYGNSLKTLSEQVGSLRKLRLLNIGRNQIERLPKNLSKCAALEVLHVYENCLRGLPSQLTNLEGLKVLNVASNADMPVPPREIRCQSDLREFISFYSTESAN